MTRKLPHPHAGSYKRVDWIQERGAARPVIHNQNVDEPLEINGNMTKLPGSREPWFVQMSRAAECPEVASPGYCTITKGVYRGSSQLGM